MTLENLSMKEKSIYFTIMSHIQIALQSEPMEKNVIAIGYKGEIPDNVRKCLRSVNISVSRIPFYNDEMTEQAYFIVVRRDNITDQQQQEEPNEKVKTSNEMWEEMYHSLNDDNSKVTFTHDYDPLIDEPNKYPGSYQLFVMTVKKFFRRNKIKDEEAIDDFKYLYGEDEEKIEIPPSPFMVFLKKVIQYIFSKLKILWDKLKNLIADEF